MNIYKQSTKTYFLIFWFFILQTTLSFAQFQQTSGPEGGVVSALINHNGLLLAGTGGAGIFRSTDGGSTWTPSNAGIQNLMMIGSFAQKDSVIFAGASSGLYKSTDDGLSWSPVVNYSVSSIMICGNYKFIGTSGYGVVRSEWSGNQWIPKNTGLTDLWITSLACCDSLIYAGNSEGVFVSDNWGDNWTPAGCYHPVTSLDVSQSLIFAGTGGGGIYRSVAGSNVWSYSGNGMSNGEAVMAIKGNDGIMYAGTYNTLFNNSGFYISYDNGTNWTLQNTGLTCKYVLSIECFGTIPIAGTNGGGAFSFDTSGNTWLPHNSGLINTSVQAFLVDGPDVFCGTYYSGVFVTGDNGITWNSRSSGLPNAPVDAFLQTGQNLFCGLLNGLYKSADQGLTWFFSGLSKNVYALSELPGKLLAGTNSGVYSSTDDGNSWGASGSGLPSSCRVMSLLSAGSEVFAGVTDHGVYFSNDQGSTWSARNSGISGLTVYSLIMSDTVLLVATYNGIYRSLDHGLSWSAVNNGLSSLSVNSLANAGNGILAGTDNGLYLSKNKGDTWINVSDGLVSLMINRIAVSGNSVFAGTPYNGVWSNLLSLILNTNGKAAPVDIMCYPNPARDRLTVKSSGTEKNFDAISVYDPSGNLIRSVSHPKMKQFELDVTDLPCGLYILLVRSGGIDKPSKFIVD